MSEWRETGAPSRVRDEDLLEILKRARGGPGFETLVERMQDRQAERDAERQLTPIARRKQAARRARQAGPPEDEDRHYIHSVLALCGLPYRRPQEEQREHLCEYRRNSLVVQAGHLKDPVTGRMTPQGLPYGPKARLLLWHICTMAMRQQSPVIEIADSMSAFIRSLGFPVTGGAKGTIRLFKEQLHRLAAARMQIGLWAGERSSTTLNTQPIESFDVWLPADPGQGVLWSSELRLGESFYQSLRAHALPLDLRSLRAFSHSARQIDIVLWLSYRLRHLKKPYLLTWSVLQEQFGARVGSARRFRQAFRADLAAIFEVFPELETRGARLTEAGLFLSPCDVERLFLPPIREVVKRG